MSLLSPFPPPAEHCGGVQEAVVLRQVASLLHDTLNFETFTFDPSESSEFTFASHHSSQCFSAHSTALQDFIAHFLQPLRHSYLKFSNCHFLLLSIFFTTVTVSAFSQKTGVEIGACVNKGSWDGCDCMNQHLFELNSRNHFTCSISHKDYISQRSG